MYTYVYEISVSILFSHRVQNKHTLCSVTDSIFGKSVCPLLRAPRLHYPTRSISPWSDLHLTKEALPQLIHSSPGDLLRSWEYSSERALVAFVIQLNVLAKAREPHIKLQSDQIGFVFCCTHEFATQAY